VISLLFYLLTSVCKFRTLLCVLSTSVLRVQYQFFITLLELSQLLQCNSMTRILGTLFSKCLPSVLPPFEQSLLKFYTHHQHSKLLCSALTTVWGGFSKTPLFLFTFFSQQAFKCCPMTWTAAVTNI